MVVDFLTAAFSPGEVVSAGVVILVGCWLDGGDG